MSSHDLKAYLGTEPVRPRVVTDCVALIDSQVKAKRGVSGLAIKGAYGTIKRIKKGMIPEVVEALLDDWLDKLQPYYDGWAADLPESRAGSLSEHIIAHSEQVAEELLTVTDERAERTSHKTAAKAYRKMRPSAKTNVIEAVPGLARLIENHLPPEWL